MRKPLKYLFHGWILKFNWEILQTKPKQSIHLHWVKKLDLKIVYALKSNAIFILAVFVKKVANLSFVKILYFVSVYTVLAVPKDDLSLLYFCLRAFRPKAKSESSKVNNLFEKNISTFFQIRFCLFRMHSQIFSDLDLHIMSCSV